MANTQKLTKTESARFAAANANYLRDLGWCVHESITVPATVAPWDQWLVVSGPNGHKSIAYMQVHHHTRETEAQESFALEVESPPTTCPVDLFTKADMPVALAAKQWRELVLKKERTRVALDSLEPGAWVRASGEWVTLVERSGTHAWSAKPHKNTKVFSLEEVILTADFVQQQVELGEYRVKWATEFEVNPLDDRWQPITGAQTFVFED